MFKKSYLLASLALTASLHSATASAYYLIYGPTVEYGETEIELYGHQTSDDTATLDGNQEFVLEIGKGITEKLFLEAKVIAQKTQASSLDTEAVAVEGVYQLTEQGEYSWDVGLLGELVYELDANEIEEVEFGVLLSTDFAQKMTFTTNIIAEYESAGSELEASASAQIKYRMQQNFEPALEIYSAENNNVLGPVIMGKIKAGQEKIGYEFGVLFGLDDKTPDNTVKLMVEYEF